MLKYITGLLLIGTLLSCGATAMSREVNVSGRHILVNDSIYTIKGICYHPVPKGKDKRSFENIGEDLALMVDAGINTIRVHEPINEVAVLDQINAAGLKVIISFGYDQEGKNDIRSGSFINYVNQFINHRDICSGVTMFSFTDGWWKAGNPSSQDIGGFAPNSSDVPNDGTPNEEYWGIVDLERNKTQTFARRPT